MIINTANILLVVCIVQLYAPTHITIVSMAIELGDSRKICPCAW